MNAVQKTTIQAGCRIAKSAKVNALFIFLDAIEDLGAIDTLPKGCKVILVTQQQKDKVSASRLKEIDKHSPQLLILPKIGMSRINRIKIAVMLALSNKIIHLGDKIVFISGVQELLTLDTILLIDTEKESEILTSRSMTNISDTVKPEVFEVILNIAMELASWGREGKPVGTIFVLGDEDNVLQYSRQMVINPFKGYEKEECNVVSPDLRETLREFSAIDGAFIISHDGYILSAGRYLGAASQEQLTPRGLGSRHIAAAGITELTQAVAIVISESTGDVRIFKNGKVFVEIEKTAPTSPPIPVA